MSPAQQKESGRLRQLRDEAEIEMRVAYAAETEALQRLMEAREKKNRAREKYQRARDSWLDAIATQRDQGLTPP